MKFNCESCGEVDYAVVDGYQIAERLLEGVEFQVRRDDKGVLSAKVDDSAREYFSQFNQAMYLEAARSTVEDGYGLCPDCGEELDPTSNPIQEVNLASLGDILKSAPGGVCGTAVAFYEPEVGDRVIHSPEETPSCESGDSSGGGASADLDEPAESSDSGGDSSD